MVGEVFVSAEMESARERGEHGARLAALEARELQTSAEFREIRTTLARIEARSSMQPPAPPAAANNDVAAMALAVGRLAETLAHKPMAPARGDMEVLIAEVKAIAAGASKPAHNNWLGTVGLVAIAGLGGWFLKLLTGG